MKNRERLLKSNTYEVLCRIQEHLNSGGSFCVLDAISHEEPGHKCAHDCAICIAAWMEEPAAWKP